MSVTMPRMMLMACLLSPSLSLALGLGEIHLNSSLNEPMNAEIDLIAAAPDELTALRATLASREAFTRYGIDKPPFLSSLTFKVGKSKDGHDVLLVRSSDAIPEPFVTFLVEVNWARGRLMREYTVLLDPPVYTPGESSHSAAPVAAATTGEPPARRPTPATPPPTESGAVSGMAAGAPAPTSVRVGRGDTLSRIARGLQSSATPADVDQTMIALYRSNPGAFGGNINILRQGAILRVPNADQIAALNQREAIGEVHRQMQAWLGSGEGATAAPAGHLRLVPPGTGNTPGGAANGAAGGAATEALKDRVKELEAQLAESKRLIDIRNSELAALQRKLGAAAPATPPAVTPPPPAAAPPAATAKPPVPAPAAPPPVAPSPPASVAPPSAVPPASVAPPVVAVSPPKKPAPAVDTGSWLDWVAANWWAPLALLLAVLGGLALAAMRRRREQADNFGRALEDTGVADRRDAPPKFGGARKSPESFVVEESGPHAAPPDTIDQTGIFGDTAEVRSPDDTMSSESAVNLDQGDPLAEADFHMAYGLYDQAADLVRIALEREPDRRDLRLKLLEIYFVWGNKDAFLQAAKALEASKDKAPAGEWDKIVIMGKQICPDEPMFSSNTGGGRGAGALVDLNLEGGENRVDIDLFGDPEGERSSLDHELAGEAGPAAAAARQAPGHSADADHLDFTLDAPERGADESPTREMPPPRGDEPTVESELMNFSGPDPLADLDFGGSPAGHGAVGDAHDRLATKLPPKADQTAEMSLDDLGLDLDALEQTGNSHSISELEETDHPADAPTMVAGLDERSRQLMAQAAAPDLEHTALTDRDRDLTELERELEASFVADLDSHQTSKTAVLGPESAPTVMMPRDDAAATSRFKTPEFTDHDATDSDLDSTSKLRGINSESIDLDLDHLTSALGGGDTLEQPRADEDLFSTEVFESSQRNKLVDLDVGESMEAPDAPTNKLQAQTNKLKPVDLDVPELEPVTMSEVGTKLDLARAYMDMGDPEGARSILEEVVQEGSSSQKQEASRLIESLPG